MRTKSKQAVKAVTIKVDAAALNRAREYAKAQRRSLSAQVAMVIEERFAASKCEAIQHGREKP